MKLPPELDPERVAREALRAYDNNPARVADYPEIESARAGMLAAYRDVAGWGLNWKARQNVNKRIAALEGGVMNRLEELDELFETADPLRFHQAAEDAWLPLAKVVRAAIDLMVAQQKAFNDPQAENFKDVGKAMDQIEAAVRGFEEGG